MKRVLAIRLLWLAAFAAAVGFCPIVPAQPAEPLREARAVLNLPPSEASRGLPVVLRGVITYLKPEGRPDLIVQDDTAGIFVNDLTDNPPPELRPGAFIELRGVTAQGNFGPAVRYQSFTVLGTRPLPEPTRASFDDLQSARFHSQYVEVAGVVRSVQIDWQLTPVRLLLKLATPAGQMDVWVLRFTEDEGLRLVDARVRVRGVCLYWSNTRRQPFSFRILVNDLPTLVVDRPGQLDPFLAPHLPLDALLQYRPGGLDQHRIRIRGVVTLHRPSEVLILQNGPLGVKIRPAVSAAVSVGDEVEAAGFVGGGGYTAELQDAVFRVLGHPGPPAPQRLNQRGFARNLEAPDLDQKLVQLQAGVTAMRHHSAELVLQLETDGFLFPATLLPPPERLPRGLQPGCRVELVGIAEVRLSDRVRLRGGGPDLFALTLRDAQDIRVLQRGPWFTVKRLLLASGLGLGALALALLWAFALRQRVEKRTAQLAREIRARHDAEIEFKATLAERSRVGADLHDTLEQSLTGLSLQLQAAQLAFEAQPKQSRDYLQTARRLLDQSRNDLRQSLGRLRSDGRPRRDLVTELQEMAEPMALGTDRGIVVEGSCPAEQVPELIGHHALRICQEALTNAVKHSQAKTIRVIIGCAKGTLTLQVLDDGVGFHPNQAPGPDNGHFGLSGMQERVKRFGGTLSIESAPGQGTQLEARIPLPPLQPLSTT